MEKPLLYMHDAYFSYEKNIDARDICFSLNRGEIVSLYGLGTAGHHALSDFLGGSCRQVSGTVLFNGVPPVEGPVLTAPSKYGIYRFEPFTPQVNSLSVLEYLFLIRPEKYICWLWNEKQLICRAQELFETAGLHCPVHTQTGNLSAVEFLQLQSAKAVDMHMKIVLFSEDISDFPEADIRKFRETLTVLKKHDISTIICSDSIPEEPGCSDRIYLFRDGAIVKKQTPIQYNRQKALVYVKSADTFRKEKIQKKKIPLFSVSGLAVSEGKSLEFSAYKSEAINLINYSFTSRERIFKLLTGEKNDPALKIQIEQEPVRPVSCQSLFKKKVAAVRFFSEKSGFPKLSVADNMVIPSLKKICMSGLFITDKAGKALYRQIRKQYPELPEYMADCSLSERIIVQMESLIVFGPEVLIMLDPFFLLDTKCRTILRNYINIFVKRGTAVLLISPGGSAYAAVCSRTIQAA